MVSSGPGHGDDLNEARGQMSRLEVALDGQAAETIIRVRNYARTFDLDDDDELFTFAAALGLLTVLIEDAPENWRAFFDGVLQDLDRWAEENRRSFAQLEQYSSAANGLAEVLESSILGIDKANESRQTLRQEVLQAVGKNADLTRQLASELGTRLDTTDQRIEAVKEVSTMAAMVARAGVAAAGVLLLFGGITSMRLIGQNKALKQELAAMQKEVGYIFEKANRAECLNGIKPPSAPQCQQFQ